MAVDPTILARVMGQSAPVGNSRGMMLAQMLAGAGAGLSRASRPGLNGGSFGEALGAGAMGMLQGQQAAQQQQRQAQLMRVRELQLAQAAEKMERDRARAENLKRLIGGTEAKLEENPLAMPGGPQFQMQPAQPGIAANLPPAAQRLLQTMSPDNQEALLAQMMFPGPQDTPARIQEAQIIARQTGRPLADVLMQMRDSGGQNINVNVGLPEQEKAFGKTYGGGLADQALALEASAAGAAQVASQAEDIHNMLAGIDTGALTNVTMDAARLVNSFGLDPEKVGLPDKDQISQAEAARALQNQMALMVRNADSGMGMPGATSNRDIKFLLDSVPNLNQTQAGRELLVDTLRERANFLRYLTRKQNEYMRAHNGQLDQGWSDFRLNAIEDYEGFKPIRERAEQLKEGGGGGGDNYFRPVENSGPRLAPVSVPEQAPTTPAGSEPSLEDLLNQYGG